MHEITNNKRGTGFLTMILLICFPVAAMADGSSISSIDWNSFLGPFHNVILHYPIGFVTMACMLELYVIFKGHTKTSKDITQLVLWLTIGSTILAASLGFARASDGGYNNETLFQHKVFGILVIVSTTFAIGSYRKASRDGSSLIWRFAYQICLLLTFGTMVTTGHKGGNLTHGSSYLIKNAPTAIKQLFGAEKEKSLSEESETHNGKGNSPEKSVFAQTIWPILEAKCIPCHGEEKHKGSFRLDTSDFALTPGDSEELPIVPNDPDNSFLVELISMDPDSDEVMPPSGKEPLSEEEKQAIIQWISDGASYSLTEKQPQ